MSKLVWTAEPPTVEGAYWFRDGFGVRICYLKPYSFTNYRSMETVKTMEVYCINTNKLMVTFSNGKLEEWHGEWAGPLEQPEVA